MLTTDPAMSQFSADMQRLSDALTGRPVVHQVQQQRRNSSMRQVETSTEIAPVTSGLAPTAALTSTRVSEWLPGQTPSLNKSKTLPDRKPPPEDPQVPWLKLKSKDTFVCSVDETSVMVRRFSDSGLNLAAASTVEQTSNRPASVAKTTSSLDVSVVLTIEPLDDVRQTFHGATSALATASTQTVTNTHQRPGVGQVEVTTGGNASESAVVAATSADPSSPGVRRSADWNTLTEMSRNEDVRRCIYWMCFFLPFLFILLARAFFVHTSEIIPLVVLFATFLYANSVVLRYISTKTFYGFFLLVCAIGLLAFEAHYLYVILNGLDRCENLLFFTRPDGWLSHKLTSQSSAFTTLWYVLITDCIAKFLTIFLKSLVAVLPKFLMNLKRKPLCYQWIEKSSHVYRWWLPYLPWHTYLMTPEYSIFVQYALVTIYLGLKFVFSLEIISTWWKCTFILLKPTTFGETPDEIDLEKNGPQCSICFSPFQVPTKLECKHIFCEECIFTWLSKERTCPICRTEVSKEDKSWRDGSTSLNVCFC